MYTDIVFLCVFVSQMWNTETDEELFVWDLPSKNCYEDIMCLALSGDNRCIMASGCYGSVAVSICKINEHETTAVSTLSFFSCTFLPPYILLSPTFLPPSTFHPPPHSLLPSLTRSGTQAQGVLCSLLPAANLLWIHPVPLIILAPWLQWIILSSKCVH